MCGIIGIASCFPIGSREWLVAGRDTMVHRGPDDAGAWWLGDGRVGLAHRRLAIIDLSPAGHQPMLDGTGSLSIVFNGEIYNYLDLQRELQGKGHTFRSQSDTEVILAAYREWGTDALSRFNGMFAFALFDASRHILFLARDRAGEKPLFYVEADGVLRFASELKGLMADPALSRCIDTGALDLYLSWGYVPGDRCIMQGVKKLPPAHAMIFDLTSGLSRVWRYWKLPEPPSHLDSGSLDEQMLLDELEALLQDAVRRQMVADVPVGILLSGGVDSSLVTALAVRASSRVKSFTVSFQNFRDYDEAVHARMIARYFNTEHTELDAGRIIPDLLTQLARQYDEPIIDSSMIPTFMVSQLVRRHCTVILGGDGGDELFGGYPTYSRILWLSDKLGWWPLALRRGIALGAGSILPTGFKGRNWLRLLGCDFSHNLPLVASYFDSTERRQLMGGTSNYPWSPDTENFLASRTPDASDLLQRATRMDFENYMAEDILVKTDQASMLNSIELRAPFLDYRVIEFAFGRVPSHLKTTITQRKTLLKRLAARLLPKEFDLERKKGFSIPLSDWLKGDLWKDYFHDILHDQQCIFDKKAITRLFRLQEWGMKNEERLFGLVLFELWRHEYKMTI